jgi:hypothetical protein
MPHWSIKGNAGDRVFGQLPIKRFNELRRLKANENLASAIPAFLDTDVDQATYDQVAKSIVESVTPPRRCTPFSGMRFSLYSMGI